MMYVFLSFLCIQNSAYADAKEAEQNRIRSEIQQYRKTSDWNSMNKAYEKLSDLQTGKNPLKFSDYILGAYVAQELGFLNDCVERLQSALRINPQAEEEKAWLALILDSTEEVSLRVSTKERTLLIEDMPFDPAFQKAIDVADLAFQTEGRFTGLLPFGVYTYGDQTFTVEKGSKAKLKKIVIPEMEEEKEAVVQTKKKNKKSKPAKKPKKKTPREIYDYSIFSLDLMVQQVQFRYKVDPSLNFRSSGLGAGILYRLPLKELINLDLAIVIGGQFEYLSSNITNFWGGVGRVSLAKRFGNLELGMGYWGHASFIDWDCSDIQSSICFEDEGDLPVKRERSPYLAHMGSGFGLSVSYDITKYIALEYAPSYTLDGDYSPFFRHSAHVQIAFR